MEFEEQPRNRGRAFTVDGAVKEAQRPANFPRCWQGCAYVIASTKNIESIAKPSMRTQSTRGSYLVTLVNCRNLCYCQEEAGSRQTTPPMVSVPSVGRNIAKIRLAWNLIMPRVRGSAPFQTDETKELLETCKRTATAWLKPSHKQLRASLHVQSLINELGSNRRQYLNRRASGVEFGGVTHMRVYEIQAIKLEE
ncbi:hypothetical protein CPB83DRAFT_840312 [Crepidotus variabilis]|uniref:Uncharacterized protein n=1 Tax=Crepidotus variabilis TaxID=179855 RepID=A0A9P6E4Z8_9AGAR|nr:hypothetical protein CPB83DRAFT_840312 [Crepidotus variabilis]